MSIYEVKEILGHADIKTTMRYAHLAPSTKSRFVGVLDTLASETSAHGYGTKAAQNGS